MSEVVFKKVVKRLLNVFGPPTNGDPEDVFAEFDKAFRGYTADVLEAAIDRVMKEHVYASWPTVGEVMAAVQAVLAARGTGRAPEHVKFSVVSSRADKAPVDPAEAIRLMSSFTKSIEANNDFPAIIERCPIGGNVDMRRPWGEEVHDRNGKIVPIRKRKGAA